jgi:dTDP-4-dehydrorhamnose 3,5-epimerase
MRISASNGYDQPKGPVAMKLISTSLPEVLLIEPQVFKDGRGLFMEIFHRKRYDEAGIGSVFVQDNLSVSSRDTLRGLHYQLHHPQAKLVHVVAGAVFDVAVDIRRGSPTFGRWVGTQLTEENKRQVYIPKGYAHGFCVLSETAEVIYKCTDFYSPNDERGILWSDSTLAIEWPATRPILSDKDRRAPLFSEISDDQLPVYRECK